MLIKTIQYMLILEVQNQTFSQKEVVYICKQKQNMVNNFVYYMSQNIWGHKHLVEFF